MSTVFFKIHSQNTAFHPHSFLHSVSLTVEWSGKEAHRGNSTGICFSFFHFSNIFVCLLRFDCSQFVFFFLILHDCLPFLGALFYKTISSLCCISSLGFIPLTFLTCLWPAVYISPYTFRFWFW